MMKNDSSVKMLSSHWQTLQPPLIKGMGYKRLLQKEDTDIYLNVFGRKGGDCILGASARHFDHVAISLLGFSENTDAL